MFSSGVLHGMEAPVAPFQDSSRGKTTTAKAQLEKRGVTYGGKKLLLMENGVLFLQSNGRKIYDIYMSFGSQFANWMHIADKRIINRRFEADMEKRCFVYEAEVPLHKDAAGKLTYSQYRMNFQIMPDDRIKLDVSLEAPEEYQKYMHDSIMNFEAPMELFRGKSFQIDAATGKLTSVEEKTPREKEPENKFPRREIFEGKFENLKIAEDDALISLGISGNARLRFFECWHLDRVPFVWARFFVLDRKKQRLTMFLDMRNICESSLKTSSDTYAGIDFWRNDHLHVPDYGKKNLIQNPSFEAGLRYFTGFYLNADKKSRLYRNMYTIDTQEARSGNQSLRLRAVKALGSHPASLNSMAIPVEEGQSYTLSAYVKGNKTKGLFLRFGVLSGKWPLMLDSQNFPLSDEWQRLSYTFKAPNNALKLEIRALYTGDAPSGEGVVWVDDLQLEKGDAATVFASRGFEAELLSSNQYNFLSPADKPDMKMMVRTSPEASGKMSLSLVDFFYKNVWTGNFDFKTDAAGEAVIPLGISSLPHGIMVMDAEFSLDGGKNFREWFRLAVMDKLKNKHRWKNICGTGIQANTPLWEEQLARCRDIGFGSTTYISDDKDVYEKFNEFRIDSFTKEVFDEAKYGGCIEVDGKVLLRDMRKISSVTPELEKQVEEASYLKAKSMPWIKHWCFCRENRIIFPELLPAGTEGFAKLLLACRKGIKRFNPEAVVTVDGGPANMMPGSGIQELESYIKSTVETAEFDGTAIHPYRPSPEDPDLDTDARHLFAMLKKYGYDDKPVYWNEGIYYCPYTIPEWGLSVNSGYDHWRVGSPSYHMGWSERVSAAKYARSWLVAFKYHDIVKQFNGWSYWIFLDANLAPLALQKIPNTLGRLLGNATFKEDIRFAPKVRCYLFEDEKQRPVAAIWSYRDGLDIGTERAPEASFDFGADEPEIYDLMEVKQNFIREDKRCRLPVSNFPVFLRGRPGTLAHMAKAIKGGRMIGEYVSPIELSAIPVNTRQIAISCNNLLSVPFHGVLKIAGAENTASYQLDIPGNEVREIIVEALVSLSYSKLVEIKFPVTVDGQGMETLESEVEFRGFAVKKAHKPIAIDGNLDDWNEYPPIAIDGKLIRKPKYPSDKEAGGYAGDLEADYRMTWDENYLYLAVNVKDDKLVNDSSKKPAARWNGDCVQLYIDTLADAGRKTAKGFDGNDYNYDLFPNFKEQTVTVFRRFSAEQQQAGGLYAPKANEIATEVKSALKITPHGYIIELAFPAWSIAPLNLKTGSVAGLALIVNDMDQKVLKDSIMTTPNGIQPYNNPHLYPLMLLTE